MAYKGIMRRYMRAAALGVLLPPSLTAAQTPAPAERQASAPAQEAAASKSDQVFPSQIELVTVDVVVVDKKGQAVPGFKASDFQVYEDGKLQTITSYESVALPTAPAGAPREASAAARVSSNQGAQARSYRTFVVVFDDIHLSQGQAFRAKAAVAEFLRRGLREGDVVSLIATGGGAWWTARMPEGREELLTILKRLTGRYYAETSPDRVTDYEAMRIVEYDDQEVAYQVQRRFDAYGAVGRDRAPDRQYADTLSTTSAVGLIDPYVRSRSVEVNRQSIERRRITMRIMTRALQALGSVRGRKAMVLVSQGFVYQPDFKEMREVVEASTRVNVPIHFIDTRGLEALPDFMTSTFTVNVDVQDTVAAIADITREADGSANLALDTGGLVFKNTNDLTGRLLQVSDESRVYYLLGYQPSNTLRDGKFRKIEVRLKAESIKGLKLRARRGYFAPLEARVTPAASPTDPAVIRALDAPFELRDVPLRVEDFCFDEAQSKRVSVMMAVEVDLAALQLGDAEGRKRGDAAFVMELQHLESGEYSRIDEKIEMAMLPETYERLLREGYLVTRDFTLAPGSYQAKVVVKDLASGRVGSVLHDFRVPDAPTFRLSTPLLSNSLEERDPHAKTAPRPVLRMERRFEPDSTLYVQYSVLGAAREQASLMPQVLGGYEIRRSDGSIFKRAQLTPINPTSLGALLRLHGINLGGAQPGEYELVLRVRDSLAGRDLEVREPFSIGGAKREHKAAAS